MAPYLNLALIALASVVTAVPKLNFPIKSQYVPMARVGQAFEYQFPIATFAGIGNEVSYTIKDGPPWLSIQSNTRTLTGTPSEKDVGLKRFGLIASDGSGSAEAKAAIKIQNLPAPQIRESVGTQLERRFKMAGPHTIRFDSNSAFDFSFSLNTFIHKSNVPRRKFVAILQDHTPLPSWIKFQSSQLRFYGQTPSVMAAAHIYDILMIVADEDEFAEASLKFSLVVSNHTLFFDPWEHDFVVNNPTADSFDVKPYLLLDGNPPQDSDLFNFTSNSSAMLVFNEGNVGISGQVPKSFHIDSGTVTVKDQYGDEASAVVHFRFNSQLFQRHIKPLRVFPGEKLMHTFDRSFLKDPNSAVTMNIGPPYSKWLTFHSGELQLTGKVPSDLPPSIIALNMEAKLPNSNVKEGFPIRISVGAAKEKTSGESDGKQSEHVNGQQKKSIDRSASSLSATEQSWKVPLVVACVCFSVLIVLFFTSFCCYFSRKKIQRKLIKKGFLKDKEAESQKPISEMMSTTSTKNNRAASVCTRVDEEMTGDDGRCDSYAPQISLDFGGVYSRDRKEDMIDGRPSRSIKSFESYRNMHNGANENNFIGPFRSANNSGVSLMTTTTPGSERPGFKNGRSPHEFADNTTMAMRFERPVGAAQNPYLIDVKRGLESRPPYRPGSGTDRNRFLQHPGQDHGYNHDWVRSSKTHLDPRTGVFDRRFSDVSSSVYSSANSMKSTVPKSSGSGGAGQPGELWAPGKQSFGSASEFSRSSTNLTTIRNDCRFPGKVRDRSMGERSSSMMMMIGGGANNKREEKEANSMNKVKTRRWMAVDNEHQSGDSQRNVEKQPMTHSKSQMILRVSIGDEDGGKGIEHEIERQIRGNAREGGLDDKNAHTPAEQCGAVVNSEEGETEEEKI